MYRNTHFACLEGAYLFPQIQARKARYLSEHPEAALIDLGIGDTRLPIPDVVAQAMGNYSMDLATPAGYRGYGDEQGTKELRERIAEIHYRAAISTDEIFIGDGTKCDIARLQVLLGPDAIIGIQDPTYPAYRDSALLTGGGLRTRDGRQRLQFLPCTLENGYFPDLERADPTIDALFFCSPNNPTGHAATREQLQNLVDWARLHEVLIVFDAAYSWYVRDPKIPKSIFEVEGAERCSIEFNSFSKMVGFTGVRLSWSAIPHNLTYADGTRLLPDWRRIATTLFNGASNIAQMGGVACLTSEGLLEIQTRIDTYLSNATMLRDALSERGIRCSGGQNAPYLWAHFPGHSSWDVFDRLLTDCRIVCTPGSGFGQCGESHIRLSAFASARDAARAAERLASIAPALR